MVLGTSNDKACRIWTLGDQRLRVSLVPVIEKVFLLIDSLFGFCIKLYVWWIRFYEKSCNANLTFFSTL